MLKKCTLILITFIWISILPGCWDYSDLDQQSIPIVGIYDVSKDKTENKYIVGGIYPTLEKNIEKEYKIEFIEGQTIGDTREKRSFSSSEIFAVGMLESAVYGEELARQGLNTITDILFRMPQIANTLNVAVIEGNVLDLENIKLKENIDLGLYIKNLLKNAQENAFFPTRILHDYGVNEASIGRNPIIPLIKIKDNSGIVLSGTGIFKKDTLIEKIGLQETRSLVLLRGLKSRGNIPFTIEENGKIIDEGTVSVKNSRDVKVKRNGNNYTFYITIKLTGNLIEHFPYNVIISEKPIIKLEEIEKAVEDEIKKQCQDFVEKMQNEFKVDCIDITKYALAKWRKELENEVDDGFIENVKILVDVKVKIKDIGDLT